jgi:hypothetical protein
MILLSNNSLEVLLLTSAMLVGTEVVPRSGAHVAHRRRPSGENSGNRLPFDLGMAPRIGCHRRMERSNKPATNRAPPSLSPRSSSRISCHRQRCRRSRDVLGTSADPARRYARGARHSARHVPRRKKWRQAPKCARHAALGSSAEKVASLGRRSRPQPECREYTSLNL